MLILFLKFLKRVKFSNFCQKLEKKRNSVRTADIQFLPFNVGVLEVLLAGVGIRAGAVAAAALAGLDGVDDDEDQEEDSEDAADDDRDQ